MGGALPDLYHAGYGSNKQLFRSTTEVSNILAKSLNAVLILSARGMLFLSEEERSRGKAWGIFSVSGLSVWQMSSDLSDGQAEPQFRNFSGTKQSGLWKTHKPSQNQKKKIKTATLFTNPFTVPFCAFFST